MVELNKWSTKWSDDLAELVGNACDTFKSQFVA
jgi:hypothetical protein